MNPGTSELTRRFVAAMASFLIKPERHLQCEIVGTTGPPTSQIEEILMMEPPPCLSGAQLAHPKKNCCLIYRNNTVPILERQLVDGVVRNDSCVIHQDIYTTMFSDHVFDEVLPAFFLRNILLHVFNSVCEVMMGRLARGNDDGTFAGESFCDRAADAASGSVTWRL
jgi:hypothetical protein